MPAPLVNAERMDGGRKFSPENLLKLTLGLNRELVALDPPPQTIADVIASEEALRVLRLDRSHPETFDALFYHSLRDNGQSTDGTVRQSTGGVWELIAGCRRATVFALLNREDEEAGEEPRRIFRARQLQVSEKEAYTLRLQDNHSLPLGVEAKALWARDGEVRYGMSRAETAAALGVTMSCVGSWISILALPQRALVALREGRITFETAKLWLSVKPSQIAAYLDRLESGEASGRDLKADTKKAKRASGGRAGRSSSEARKEVKAALPTASPAAQALLRRVLSWLEGESDIEDVLEGLGGEGGGIGGETPDEDDEGDILDAEFSAVYADREGVDGDTHLGTGAYEMQTERVV